MKINLLLPAVLIGLINYTARADTSSATPAEIATKFLRDLEKSEVDEAMKLWAPDATNERLKERVRRMSAKIVALGGIKKIETPPVEKRPKNLESHEVVVIVVYGNRDLAFGSISFVEKDGQYKISNLRSEQGWGGTTSLFDETSTGSSPEQ